MKIGEIVTVDLVQMLLPMVGNLVEVTPVGEDKPVKARIIGVNYLGAKLKVVPKDTKD